MYKNKSKKSLRNSTPLKNIPGVPRQIDFMKTKDIFTVKSI